MLEYRKVYKGCFRVSSMKQLTDDKQNRTNTTEISNALLEIRGILRTLADSKSQSITTPKRLMELNNFLKELEFGFKRIKILK